MIQIRSLFMRKKKKIWFIVHAEKKICRITWWLLQNNKATGFDIQNILNLSALSPRNAFNASGPLFHVTHLRTQACCVCQVGLPTLWTWARLQLRSLPVGGSPIQSLPIRRAHLAYSPTSVLPFSQICTEWYINTKKIDKVDLNSASTGSVCC